jgi:hypothetical protein
MATQLLSNLQFLIDNAKQTQSGKVEWTTDSLKGILEEVLSLFATNALQLTNNTTSLQNLEGANGNTCIVTDDNDGKYNGIYIYDINHIYNVYFPAANGGYWNYVLPFSIGDVSVSKYLAVDVDNSQLELGENLVSTGTHTVLDKWVKVNIPGIGTRYLPLYQ